MSGSTVNISVFTLHSGGVCDGDAVLSGYLPVLLPAHLAGGLSGKQAVRFCTFLSYSLCSPHIHRLVSLLRYLQLGI